MADVPGIPPLPPPPSDSSAQTFANESVLRGLDEISDRLKSLTDVGALSSQSISTLIAIHEKSIATMRELSGESEKNRQADEKRKDSLRTEYRQKEQLSLIDQRLIGNIGELAKEGGILSASFSVASGAISLLGPDGAAIGMVVSGVKSIVGAYSETIKAQKAVVDTQFQLGLTYRDNSVLVEANRKKLESTAAVWGMLGEKAAEFYAQAAGAGVGARPGETGAARAASAGDDLAAAFEAATATSRAYGIAEGETMKNVVDLGTVFGARGREFSIIMGEMTEMGSRSVLGERRYLETVRSLTDSTKEYGANLFAINVFTEVFGKELKAGTISLDTIAKLAVPAKLGTEGLAFVTAMAQRAGVEINGVSLSSMSLLKAMDTVALSSDGLNKALAGQHANQKDVAQSIDMVRQSFYRAGLDVDQMSGTEKQKLLESIGIHTELIGAMSIFKGSAQEAAAELVKIQQGKAGEDPATRLANAGKIAFDAFKTPTESFASATMTFRDAVRDFADAERSGLKDIAASVLKSGFGGTISAVIGGISEEIGDRFGMSSPGYVPPLKSHASGGIIPENGEYYLHAGERVVRPGGGGGGISVSLGGGISVTIGERGSLKSELHEAMAEVESRVLKTIEEQMNQANFS